MQNITQHIAMLTKSPRLFISTVLLKEAGVSAKTIEFARSRNSRGWSFHKEKGIAHLWVEWHRLKEQYRTQVTNYLKQDPAAMLAQHEVFKYYKLDDQAREFFENYIQPNGEGLTRNFDNPEKDLVNKYTQMASWLNLYAYLQDNPNLLPYTLYRELRKNGWAAFRNLARLHKGNLPNSYGRLQQLRNYYLPTKHDYPAYGILVNGRVGNSHNRKIDDDGLNMLLELLAFPRQMDFPQIKNTYNKWASDNGKCTIESSKTVGIYYNKYEKEIIHMRHGRKAHYDTVTKVIHRRPTSIPLAYVNADDNALDLNFVSYKDHRTQKNVTAYIFTDTHLGYPLGYAVAETPSFDLIRLAALNAIHHIHEITGQWAVWHQLQADRFAHKMMEDWAKRHCVYTPAPARKARGKHIEAHFGKPLHDLHKVLNHNYTGHNIRANKTGVNPDYVADMRRFLPTDADAHAQVAWMIEIWRHMPTSNKGPGLQEKWLENFKALKPEQIRLLSETDRYMYFGLPHARGGHAYTNKLRNTGISVKLPGIGKKVFDVPEPHYTRHLFKNFSIIYDPYIPNQVLALADEGRTRLLLGEYEPVASNLYDRQPGEGKVIQARLKEQKAADQWLIDQRKYRSDKVLEMGVDVEQLIKGALLNGKQQQILIEQTFKQGQLNGANGKPNGVKKAAKALPGNNTAGEIDYFRKAFDDF